MKHGRHACLLLILAVTGCDETETRNPESIDPSTSRPDRPQRDERPDPVKKLRADLSKAASIGSAADRDKAVAAIAWDALELDPELSQKALRSLTPGGPERTRLIQHLAMRMAEQNPDNAMNWASTLESENEKSAALGQVALVLADTDPRRAADLLSESGVEGRDFDVAAVQVVRRWASRSPADAAAWVELFPPGASRSAAIQILVSEWMTTDGQAVIGWMAGITDESIRNEIGRAMATPQKESRPPEE